MSEKILTLKQVLHKASNEELQALLKLLNNQWNSSVKKEHLNVTDINRESRIRMIEKEIREYGGNTILNMFRSDDDLVTYDEIVRDVAEKFNVKTEWKLIPDIELGIYSKILEKAVKEMSEKDRVKFFKEFNVKYSPDMNEEEIRKIILTLLSASLIPAILQIIWPVVAGTTLALGAIGVSTTAISLISLPITALIFAIWGMLDLTGPAFRVTIPCVLFVAILRRKPEPEN